MKRFALLSLILVFLSIANVHAGIFFQEEKDPCIPCEEIQKLKLPDVTILKAD